MSTYHAILTSLTDHNCRLGVIADVGQTYNTSAMMARLMEVEIDALALIGVDEQ
jgi:hypothetical protein